MNNREIINFFKENYKKNGNLYDLAIKFQKKFFFRVSYDYNEAFRNCFLHIAMLCNLDLGLKIGDEALTSAQLFQKIARRLYNYSFKYIMEIE